jgi:hypothetical protein
VIWLRAGQPRPRNDRRRLVGADLLQLPRLARNRVDARIDVDPVGAARQPLYVTSPGRHHEVTITQKLRLVPHDLTEAFEICPLSWEPPIGIEPMTYALQEGLQPSTVVQAVTSALLAWLRRLSLSHSVVGPVGLAR